MFERFKARAADSASRLLANPDVQKAVSWAAKTSSKMRRNLSDARRSIAQALSVEGQDDTRPLKKKLDRMLEQSEKEPDC